MCLMLLFTGVLDQHNSLLVSTCNLSLFLLQIYEKQSHCFHSMHSLNVSPVINLRYENPYIMKLKQVIFEINWCNKVHQFRSKITIVFVSTQSRTKSYLFLFLQFSMHLVYFAQFMGQGYCKLQHIDLPMILFVRGLKQ